jgi:GTP pyrophosphokinase
MVPLNTVLSVGDVVEIITSQSSKGPSWDWLKIVKSSSARVKIKQFFKREMKEENVRMGKVMLEAEAKRRGFSLSELLTEDSFLQISARMSFNGQDEMFSSIGYGAVSVNQVLVKLIDYYRKSQPKQEITKYFKARGVNNGVKVKGIAGLLVRFAGCCNPVPGDEIVGFVSRGRGVCIHRADCPNMRNEDPERLLEAKWSGKEGSYTTSIKITATENAPLLSIVSSVCKQLGLFVMAINGRIDSKARIAIVDMTIKLNKKDDLEDLLTKLKSENEVIDVFRTVI